MLVSAPNRGIILPPTFLIPAYNVPRPTPTLASDYNLTPTSGVIHTSHSPLPPKHSPTIHTPYISWHPDRAPEEIFQHTLLQGSPPEHALRKALWQPWPAVERTAVDSWPWSRNSAPVGLARITVK